MDGPSRAAGALAGKKWVFLGSNVEAAKSWEDCLGGDGRVASGRPLAEAAEGVRPAFRALLEKQADRFGHQRVWWLTQVSEANSAGSPVFFRVCYLEVLNRLLQKGDCPGVIVAESRGLIRCIEAMLRKKGLTYHRVRSLRKGLVLRALRPLLSTMRFLFRGLGQLARKRPRGKSYDLLVTAPGPAPGSDTAQDIDANLPGMRHWFAREDLTAAIMPSYAEDDRGRATRVGADSAYLHAPSLFAFADFVGAAVDALRLVAMPCPPVRLDRIDIRPLLLEERRVEWGLNPARTVSLYSRLPRRLRSLGFEFKRLLAWSENYNTDRGLLRGFSLSFPLARRIGLQNVPLFPNRLSTIYAESHCRAGLVPQIVLTSGSRPSEIFRAGSNRRIRTKVFCGLRYSYLHEISRKPDDTVFVAFPIFDTLVLEMIDTIAPLTQAFPQLDWVGKMHPAFSARLGEDAGLRMTDERAEGILARARVVISAGTGVALEAAALGIPVIQIGSHCMPPYDPLAWYEGVGSWAYGPDEVAVALDNAMTLDAAGRSKLEGRGKDILSTWFEPLTPQNLEALGRILA